MRRIDSVLSEALGRDEVLRAARAQRALKRWPEVVGAFLSERSWPDRFSRGTVFVAVQGSSWAQELRMRKGQILERLREFSGDRSLFQEVRFGVRALPEPEDDPLHIPPPPTSKEVRTVQDIAKKWRKKGRFKLESDANGD